ncbi:hypothetical protein [Leptothrix discophora]|uniref:Uncharacterized protein n=1 Tax=Leptothrix discophora TaxID=89 RepID=A0ABT9G2U0_LEPDI|nr:hypothetical protein [Leptothrix discophora]MDP4300498.1 hypothetical protein [Leptothrix discophora]
MPPEPATPGDVLTLDPVRNRAVLPDGQVIAWRRRWVAAMLAMLWQQAEVDQSVSLSALQAGLALRGQRQPLAAVAVLRLLGDVQGFLASLPGEPVVLEHPPRQASVGPWRLRWRRPCALRVVDTSAAWPDAALAGDGADGPEAALMQRLIAGDDPDPDALLALLRCLISFDAFQLWGQNQDALDMLAGCEALPLNDDGRALVAMRASQSLKRLGRFDDARACLRAALRLPGRQDDAATAHMHFLLARTDYDADPGGNHARLWHSCMAPPLVRQADRHLLAQWHNLRALLCRRRSEAEGHADPRWHRLALRHLEGAIAHALHQRDHAGLHAYAANLGLHLQTVRAAGWSTATQVIGWYQLLLATMDKLGVGSDNAWEYIYLAEFWLDNETELRALEARAPHAPCVPVIDDLHPRDEAYYVTTVARIAHTGDARQLALAWLCHWRHARAHLPRHRQDAIARRLREVIAREPGLHEKLLREGYGAHLSDL